MNEMIRLRKLLCALNEYMDSFSYYDEDLGDTVIDGDEDECYNVIMQDDELHLLGSETVKKRLFMYAIPTGSSSIKCADSTEHTN